MKSKWITGIILLLVILLFITTNNLKNEKKEKPVILEGQIFFDSNSNGKIDENDTVITKPLKLKIIPYILPKDKTDGLYVLSKNISYEIVSREGLYKFKVPSGVKEINIRLSDESVEYLHKTVIRQSDQKSFQTFQLILFDNLKGGELWQPDDGGTLWSSIDRIGINSTADILIVGISTRDGKFTPILFKHDFLNWTSKEQVNLLEAVEKRQNYNFSNTTERVRETYEEIMEITSKELDNEFLKIIQNYQSKIKG